MRWLMLTLAVMLAGCGNSEVQKLGSGKPAVEPWPEFLAFAQDQAMSLGYPAGANDWKGVKAAASNPAFKSSIATLEQSQAPAAYVHKDAFIKALKDLAQTAETGSADDVKQKYEAYKQAEAKLTEK
jgi:hypothetical protein